jgi:hypothetical protein
LNETQPKHYGSFSIPSFYSLVPRTISDDRRITIRTLLLLYSLLMVEPILLTVVLDLMERSGESVKKPIAQS